MSMNENFQDVEIEAMRNKLIRVVKGFNTSKAVQERMELYKVSRTKEWIAQFQVDKFNRVWGNALATSPFYRRWAEEHTLPRQIVHIEELAAFPTLRKRDITDSAVTLSNFKTKAYYVTGGSTGEPTKFPKGKDEGRLRYANRVVTYSWLGLRPGDRYVHLWGHAHLFGEGKPALIRERIRQYKDWLVGGYRLNAYKQSSEDTQTWIKTIALLRPKFIVGYASALVNLAIAIEHSGCKVVLPNLEHVISTAESISAGEINFLEKVFRVPVANEYGAVETGIIAHSRPSLGRHMQFLWGSLAGNVDGAGSLNITTLDPREFPLINYELGDRILEPNDSEHLLSFRAVEGRVRDQVSIKTRDGSVTQISMIVLVQALNNLGTVKTVQAAQVGNASVEIYVTGIEQFHLHLMKMVFLDELRKVYIQLDPESVWFRQLREPVKSIAGKTNLVVQRQKA